MASPNDFNAAMQQPQDFPQLQPNGSQPIIDEQPGDDIIMPNTGWVEPTPRTPVPSFMDQKGGQRAGYVEGMMPLGERPSSRTKIAKPDTLRRNPLARPSGLRAHDEPSATPESGFIGYSTRAQSVRTEQGNDGPTPPDMSEDPQADAMELETRQHNDALLGVDTSAADPLGNPTSPPSAFTNTRHPQTNTNFQTPFSSSFNNYQPPPPAYTLALELAAQLNVPNLGNAVTHLRLATQQDREFAELLRLVCLAAATPEQQDAFHKHVHSIKKQFKKSLREKDQYTQSQTYQPDIDLTLDPSLDPTLQMPQRKGTAAPIARMQTPARLRQSSSAPQSAIPKPLSGLKIKLPKAPGAASPAGSAAPTVPAVQEQPIGQRRPHESGRSSSLSSVDEGIAQQAVPSPTGRAPHNGSLNKSRGSMRRAAAAAAAIAPSRAASMRPQREATRKSIFHEQVMEHKKSRLNGKRRSPTDEAEREAKKQKLEEETIRPTPDIQPSHVRPVRDGVINETLTPSSREGSEARKRGASAISADGTGNDPSVPGPTNLGRPPKRVRTARGRIIISPQKNRDRPVSAGIPPKRKRNDAQKHAAVSPRDTDAEGDDDECIACGDGGFLLLCDGCNQAYHLHCNDPPLRETPPEGTHFFCGSCVAKKQVAERKEKEKKTTFSSAAAKTKKEEPSAFVLPADIKERYEGVDESKYGEYAQSVLPAKARNNLVADAASKNQWEPYDKEGKPVLCHACKKSAVVKREMERCDYCGTYWHLHCMDPIRTNPVYRGKKKEIPWMCQAHVAHDLAKFDALQRNFVSEDRVPVHKIRNVNGKQKGYIEPQFRQAYYNDGNVSVADTSEEESESEYEVDEEKKIKLSKTGMVMDFITAVKRNQFEAQRAGWEYSLSEWQQNNNLMKRNQMRLHKAMNKRDFADRKAALNLVQFSSQQELNLSTDQMQNLIDALEAEAPDEVVKQQAVQKGKPSEEEKAQLQHLIELAQKRLAA